MHQKTLGDSPSLFNQTNKWNDNFTAFQAPPIDFLEIYNSLTNQGGTLDIGNARLWRIKGYQTEDFQKNILHHERLAEHLKLRTHWKRQAIVNRYQNNDGTPGEGP